MTEVNTFITWYDTKAIGSGPATYTFNKTFNNGPFITRKDKIVFDKIEVYEVNEYTPKVN